MRARKCESKRKQAPFDWDKWRDTITARNDSAAKRNTSLVLHFQGYVDEKNAQVDTVDIDIYLAQGRNNNNIDKNKHMVRSDPLQHQLLIIIAHEYAFAVCCVTTAPCPSPIHSFFWFVSF